MSFFLKDWDWFYNLSQIDNTRQLVTDQASKKREYLLNNYFTNLSALWQIELHILSAVWQEPIRPRTEKAVKYFWSSCGVTLRQKETKVLGVHAISQWRLTKDLWATKKASTSSSICLKRQLLSKSSNSLFIKLWTWDYESSKIQSCFRAMRIKIQISSRIRNPSLVASRG